MKHLSLTFQLLDWHESKRGQKVLFEVMQDVEHPHDVNPFKEFTTRNGKNAGQLFAVVLVLLDPETGEPAAAPAAAAEQQSPQQSPPAPGNGPLPGGDGDDSEVHPMQPSNMAGLLCRDPKFQAFMEVKDEAECVAKLKELLRIKSRSELDVGRETLATVKFDELREKFRQHLMKQMTKPLDAPKEEAPRVPF